MGKIKIGVIVLIAVFGSASVVKAVESAIDFDGGLSRGVNFSEIIKTADFCKNNQNNCEKVESVPAQSVPKEAVNNGNSLPMYELSMGRKQMLQKELMFHPIESLGPNIRRLIYDENIGIMFNDEEICFVRRIAVNTYNILDRVQDKKLLNVIEKLKEPGFSSKGWVSSCRSILTWASLIKDGIEVTTQVYTWVCEQEWQGDPPINTGNPAGSGGTYHGGQGGNSNYDVNRHLK
jgi:hypothetical protein